MRPINAFGILVFALALDMRGTEGGGLLQFITFTASCASAAFLISSSRRSNLQHNPTAPNETIELALWLHLFLGALVSFAQGIDPGRVLRVGASYFLVCLGFSCARVSWAMLSEKGFLQNLWYATLFSSILYVLVGLQSGIDIRTLRYELVSPGIGVLLALALGLVHFNTGSRTIGYSVIAGIFCLFVLSATRSYLLQFAIVLFASEFLRKTTQYKWPWAILVASLKTCLIGGVFLLLYASIDFDGLMRFQDRIFSSQDTGFDITTATRLAEASDQVEQFSENIQSIMLGKGLGAAYTFSGEYGNIVGSILGSNEQDVEWWILGHNYWVYGLFAQGILLGAVHPIILIWAAVIALRNYFQHASFGTFVLFLCLLSALASTVGGNPIGTRFGALLLGLAMGRVLYQPVPKKT